MTHLQQEIVDEVLAISANESLSLVERFLESFSCSRFAVSNVLQF